MNFLYHHKKLHNKFCVLYRNLYEGQEATVRTGHGTTDWLQIEKEYVKAVYRPLLISLICRVHHEKCCTG